jgi:hypothetical protein
MYQSALFWTCAAMLLMSTGCHKLGQLFGVEQEEHIAATAFSSDPLLRRLAIAVDKADRKEISAAVQAGADVNAFGRSGFRLLDWAMARNNSPGFGALLEHGASLDALFKDPKTVPDRSYNQTVLERVLSTNRSEFIGAVLRRGINPDHVPFPEDGRSLLFFASDAQANLVVDALLDKGAAIDFRDNSGQTPLFDAMLLRNYTIAWHLLRRGADPTARNRRGNDFVWGLKQWGSRGVRPDHRLSFEAIVDELVRRGLLTRQDIVEADKPKSPNSGITVIEHSPDSEAGQAILRLDQAERDANAQDRGR